MEAKIALHEAKSQLSRIIDRAAGERIVITRNGVAVAELHPVASERFDGETLVERFEAFRMRQNRRGSLRRPGETLRGLAHHRHEQ